MSDTHIPAMAPFYTLGLAVMVVAILVLTSEIAVPIALAVLIWFLIDAFSRTIERHLRPYAAIPRTITQLISAAMLFGVIALGVNLAGAGLAELAEEAVDAPEAILARLEAMLREMGIVRTLSFEDLTARLDPQAMISGGLEIAGSLLQNASFVILYVMFLMVDQRYFGAKMRALVPDPKRRASVEGTLTRIGETTRIYLWLMSLVSAGVALVTFVICAAAGLKGAGVWAVLAFILNFVPTIGSILAVLLPVFYGLATLSDPFAVIGMIAALSATQFIAGEVVVPRVMGERLNLSSFVILLALIVWGAIWGAVGMFLAIPITVVMVLIFAQFPSTRPIAIALSKDGTVPHALEIEPQTAPPSH